MRYPDGIKYSLICLNIRTQKRVLLDNHHPKGPHLHIDDIEAEYVFKSVAELMADFTRLVFEH